MTCKTLTELNLIEVKNTSWSYSMRIKKDDVVQSTAGKTFKMTIKRKHSDTDADAVYQITGVNNVDPLTGWTVFSAPITNDIPNGLYVYDIAVFSTGVKEQITRGDFKIANTVTIATTA